MILGALLDWLAGQGRAEQASEAWSEITAIVLICTFVVCHLACIAQWGCLAWAQRCHMNIMDGLIPFLSS